MPPGALIALFPGLAYGKDVHRCSDAVSKLTLAGSGPMVWDVHAPSLASDCIFQNLSLRLLSDHGLLASAVFTKPCTVHCHTSSPHHNLPSTTYVHASPLRWPGRPFTKTRCSVVAAAAPSACFARCFPSVCRCRRMPGYPRMDVGNPYLTARYDSYIVDSLPWGRGWLVDGSQVGNSCRPSPAGGVCRIP